MLPEIETIDLFDLMEFGTVDSYVDGYRVVVKHTNGNFYAYDPSVDSYATRVDFDIATSKITSVNW